MVAMSALPSLELTVPRLTTMLGVYVVAIALDR
jgi:hypothetical protein